MVDPYAEADLILSFGEEGAEVEVGFITFISLPASLLAKVGRMRVNFGKVNTLHLHSLPWADQPLPVLNLLGSDEGWTRSGWGRGSRSAGASERWSRRRGQSTSPLDCQLALIFPPSSTLNPTASS